MKLKHFFIPLCIATLFSISGCSSMNITDPQESINPDGSVSVGTALTVSNVDEAFTLLDVNQTLANRGMYYATWSAGKRQDYTNEDGDVLDFYDAQLFLLLTESNSEKSAEENVETWLSTAREKYEILSEDEVTCGQNDYTLVTYRCTSKDNPYDQGVSAFGSCGGNAVCAELTVLDDFTMDAKTVLTGFLEGCAFKEG